MWDGLRFKGVGAGKTPFASRNLDSIFEQKLRTIEQSLSDVLLMYIHHNSLRLHGLPHEKYVHVPDAHSLSVRDRGERVYLLCYLVGI